jgi:hypothetical protein
MSFLTSKFYKWVNKQTSDPEADKLYRQQKQETRKAITIAKAIFVNQNTVLNAAKANKQVFKEDYDFLKKFNDDGIEYLNSAGELEKEDIEAYIIDNFDIPNKYNPYSLISVLVNPNLPPPRFFTRWIQKTCQQALRDNQDKIKPDVKTSLETIVSKAKTVLKDNEGSTDGSVFQSFNVQVQTDYLQGKDGAEINKLYLPAAMKVLKNGDIDFVEGPLGVTESKPASAAAAKEEVKKTRLREDKKKDDFNLKRLLFNASNYAFTIATICLILFFCLVGSSFAVNLNIYKPTPFKVLYAIYGFVFGLVVVPYVVFYRWLYKGKRPRYYGFLPFIPQYFKNTYVQFLLGWLTYRPEPSMWELQEWRAVTENLELAGVTNATGEPAQASA